ncbi:erythromycin esterase [Kribbella sp. ALI-6-A]|uniref:erythromycin esterase family protein n=1 Tax=Kribbella sp. ALI-6-A TaxID=1933817 RepID=UPI00097BCF76|nr:erythromycin esterase family protein [Kribbella sp. ALI-6-A]ONI69114.1 erythromycin esterase [Kribbella sp. ALI-6-A]
MSEPRVRQWLERTAWPLAGVEAGTPTGDLEPLKKVLADVRLVGLGESTHGTREFFQLKHRLLEFLVTELGFRTLLMEASESAAIAVDAYVRGGPGDAPTVVSDLGFWVWRTEEVVAMVQWMRKYNAGRPADEQVGFVGIDPQKCSAALAVVRGYLEQNAPERLELFDGGIAAEVDAGPGAKPDPKRLLVRETEALVGFLDKHSAPDEVLAAGEQLVRAADVVCSSKEHKDAGATTFAVRDRAMADAVSAFLHGNDLKAVLWAHNGHLAASRQSPELRPMGQYLRERYGSAYYAVALLCGSGAFRARRMWPGPWPGDLGGPVEVNKLERGGFSSLEGLLAAANPGDHFLDLRAVDEAPAEIKGWLEEPQMFRSFGAFVQRWTYKYQFAPTLLTQEYDGLVYLATTSPSRPL